MGDYLEKWHREMWAYVQMKYKVIFESLKRFEKGKTIEYMYAIPKNISKIQYCTPRN